MSKLFGTDGIRGVAGEPPLDSATIRRVGQALARVLGEAHAEPRVLVGRDTRLSGPAIEAELGRGLMAGGATTVSAGILPTPAVAYLTTALGLDAGCVVSASHNPFHDNGLKLFGRDGHKLDDASERRIEGLVAEMSDVDEDGPAPQVRSEGVDPELERRYLDHVRAVVGADFSLAGRRIVLDCANGAASMAGPELYRSLGATVEVCGASPDGRNINRECGATHPSHLAEVVQRSSAWLGIAFDGDADRCILVDDKAAIRDGDDVLAVAATVLGPRGELGSGEIVSTVMANLGLENYIQSLGLGFVRTAVGDRHVLEEMRRRGARIGGEQSGHIIFLSHATTGDGLLTSLVMARILAESGEALSSLAGRWTRLPQLLRNVRVRERVDLETLPAVRAILEEVRSELDGRGRLLVRYSGTEPLLRIMLEGESDGELGFLAGKIETVVRAEIGLDG